MMFSLLKIDSAQTKACPYSTCQPREDPIYSLKRSTQCTLGLLQRLWLLCHLQGTYCTWKKVAYLLLHVSHGQPGPSIACGYLSFWHPWLGVSKNITVPLQELARSNLPVPCPRSGTIPRSFPWRWRGADLDSDFRSERFLKCRH